MRLSELLNDLEKLAKENGLSQPYIVGGIPRDIIFGEQSNIKDIDITTGDEGSLALGMAASEKWPSAFFKVYGDNHSSLKFKNIQVDFSSNFIIPEINDELNKINIKTPTDLQKEVFSRDFTINCLLQPMDLTQPPLDLTGKAIEDIKNGVLRTPIDSMLSIGYSSRRIIRALVFAVKFNLTLVPSLENAIIKYRGAIADIPMNYIKTQINKMIEIDAKKTLKLLEKYKLLPILPLSKLMINEITKNKMVQHLIEE